MEGTPPQETGNYDEDGPATGSGEAYRSEQDRLAQLERKLGTRTWAGAVLLVLSLATAIVALVIAFDARDSAATKDEVDQISAQLSGIAEDASKAGDLQKSVDALSGRLDSLEDEVAGLSGAGSDVDGRLGVVEDDIEDLRQQISGLEDAASTPPDDSSDTDGAGQGAGN
jgi:hypothetical protein